MTEKIETSIQYQYTTCKLFNEIYHNWNQFLEEVILVDPDKSKEYFLKQWNIVKNELKDNKKITLTDIKRKVTKDDFDITLKESKSGIKIFYFSFPNYDELDGACQYVALVLQSKLPKFYTLECVRKVGKNKTNYLVGGYEFDKRKTKVFHITYGFLKEKNLEQFENEIIKIVDNNE